MNAKATRVRYVVLAFACALSMITYLDRACFGTVLRTLVKELSFTSTADLKWALTAFSISYAVFEIPTGWLGDVWGPRRTLIRIVLWWSVFTALTGIVGWKFGTLPAAGLGTLVVLRFLFGAGEAGAYPNITRALHNWFPRHQTATAQGCIWMSGRLMAGLTPVIWTLLVVGSSATSPLMTWRAAFLLFGLIGVAWCSAFAWFFRDHPHEHPLVNAAERDEIERGRGTEEASHSGLPVRSFLRSRSLWLLCLMYTCTNYGWAFNLMYFPSHLQERFQLPEGSWLVAIYQGGPLWMGAIGCLAGGWFVDWLIRVTGDRRRTRQRVGMVGQSLAAGCWIAATFAPNFHLFFLAVSLAGLFNDITVPSAWAACQDIGQRYTAVAAACMNTIGTLGSAAVGWVTGTLVQQAIAARAGTLQMPVDQLSSAERLSAEIAGFDYSMLTYAAAYILSAVCWRFIDSTKPIVRSETPEATR